MASSLQSTARSTNDVDIVVDLRPDQVSALARALGDEFSVDEEMLVDAARRRTSWNIFHLPTALKIVLILVKDAAFDREEFARRRRFRIDVDVEPFLKSTEDSVLRKLKWFHDGGESSSTQWRAVVELLRVNRGALDEPYLDRWAQELGVEQLLAKARAEAALPR